MFFTEANFTHELSVCDFLKKRSKVADHVSSFEGKALAGVKEKKNSNRGSENVNIELEDGERGQE